ncbi:MAG: hypothetical protein WC450_12560 [Candidatus Omnitrophota bacterium]|jgi:hypothetical protein
MFTITEATNFLRIFRLPAQYPTGYCFAGGYPVEMQLVDWFNAFDPTAFWDNERFEYEAGNPEYLEHINSLKEFISDKCYVKAHPNKVFLVITDYGDSFLVNSEQNRLRLETEMKKYEGQSGREGNA